MQRSNELSSAQYVSLEGITVLKVRHELYKAAAFDVQPASKTAT